MNSFKLLVRFIAAIGGYKILQQEYDKARKFWTKVSIENNWIRKEGMYVVLYVNICDLRIADHVYTPADNKFDSIMFTHCDMDYCEKCIGVTL